MSLATMRKAGSTYHRMPAKMLDTKKELQQGRGASTLCCQAARWDWEHPHRHTAPPPGVPKRPPLPSQNLCDNDAGKRVSPTPGLHCPAPRRHRLGCSPGKRLALKASRWTARYPLASAAAGKGAPLRHGCLSGQGPHGALRLYGTAVHLLRTPSSCTPAATPHLGTVVTRMIMWIHA